MKKQTNKGAKVATLLMIVIVLGIVDAACTNKIFSTAKRAGIFDEKTIVIKIDTSKIDYFNSGPVWGNVKIIGNQVFIRYQLKEEYLRDFIESLQKKPDKDFLKTSSLFKPKHYNTTMKKSEVIFPITARLKATVTELVNSTVDWNRGQLNAQNFKGTNFVAPPACLVAVGEIDWEGKNPNSIFQHGDGEIIITIIQDNFLESREGAITEQSMLTPKMDFVEKIKDVLTGFAHAAPLLRYKFSPLLVSRDHETEFRNSPDQNLIIDKITFSTRFTRKSIC